MFQMMQFFRYGMLAPWWWIFAAYWIISIIFIVWALIDIARADKDTGYKIIWAILAIFLGLIGVLLYYVLEKGRKQGGKKAARR